MELPLFPPEDAPDDHTSENSVRCDYVNAYMKLKPNERRASLTQLLLDVLDIEEQDERGDTIIEMLKVIGER